MNRFAHAVLALGAVWVVPAHGELYRYRDKQGDEHFTNIPQNAPSAWQHRQPSAESRRVAFKAWFDAAGELYAVPPALLMAIAAAESQFNASAISPAGAKGVMQLIDSTAREMQVNNVFDAKQNIFGASRYVRLLANRFEGDLVRTLAAYNAGPERVEKAGNVPAIQETQEYVRRVLHLYAVYSQTP